MDVSTPGQSMARSADCGQLRLEGRTAEMGVQTVNLGHSRGRSVHICLVVGRSFFHGFVGHFVIGLATKVCEQFHNYYPKQSTSVRAKPSSVVRDCGLQDL